MGRFRCIFLIFALLLGVSVTSYGQEKEGPPSPTEKSHTDPPCDPGNSDGDGVPPPVGLCLPIDDYVYVLMTVGLMYGCYKIRDFNVA